MAVKDLKPESVSDFWHKAGSWVAIVGGIVSSLAAVPVPPTFGGSNLLLYILGGLGALGVIGDGLKKKQ